MKLLLFSRCLSVAPCLGLSVPFLSAEDAKRSKPEAGSPSKALMLSAETPFNDEHKALSGAIDKIKAKANYIKNGIGLVSFLNT